jgi:hypothetical protein
MADLITGKTLAGLLQVTPMAVVQARKRGRIRFADEGRKLFDRVEALAAWPNRERVPINGSAVPATGDAALLLAARRRREEALASSAELALARERGEVRNTRELMLLIANRDGHHIQRLKAIPSRLRPVLANRLPDGLAHSIGAEVSRLITEVVHEFLQGRELV